LAKSHPQKLIDLFSKPGGPEFMAVDQEFERRLTLTAIAIEVSSTQPAQWER